MRDEYRKWIDENVKSSREALGRCWDTCERMQSQFSELVLHGGYVKLDLGHDFHVWLVAPDGERVDPTESQFGDPLHPDAYVDSGLSDMSAAFEWYLDLGAKEFNEFLASQ